jgi:eukaryotic-like serine/threonine-protein kinase
MTGRTISHYKILEKLGSGGMGVVYRAEDLKLGRFVALKFLSDQSGSDPANLERFMREARAVSALSHPNICTIYEIDEREGQTFISMELLEGRSLDAEPHGKALAIEKLLNMALQLAAGLEAAHSKGITHRDIKPANLFLTKQGQLKILDFGLAKMASSNVDDADAAETVAATPSENLTSPGSAVGTIAYMSPEQAKGDEIDTRTDLFSAGSVLYELAAGARPFAGRTSAIVFEAILNREPVSARELNPSLPVELGRIIEKCLEKDREVRYQHAADLGADLKRLKRDKTSGKQREFGEQEEKSIAGDATSSAPLSVARAERGSSSAILAAAKQHRFGTGAALIVVFALMAAAAYGIYELARRPKHALFEKYTVTQVTDFGDVENTAISPDGKYLAFVRTAIGKARNLWLRQLSTNSDTQVLSPIERVLSLSFSPDQSYLFYRIAQAEDITRSNLYRVPILGGKPQIVVQNIDGDVSFVNDGRELCFEREVIQPQGYSIVLRDLNTSAEEILLHGLSPVPEALACSQDGKTAMLFFSRLEGSPENYLSVASLPNGNPKVLVKLGLGGAEVGSMAWLPNQDGVILAKATSPDHRAKLVYVTYPDGSQRQIINDLSAYDFGGISSDGKTLSAVKRERATSFHIWSNEQAENSKILESLKNPVYFWWSDSGNLLFSTPGMDLKMANLTTGESTSISADQTHRLWQASLCGHDDIVAIGTGSDDRSQNVWRLNLATGAYKQITNGFDDLYPQCTMDGKWIVYVFVDGDNGKLMRVPAEGGTPVEIPGQSFVSFDLSPDGTQLVDWDPYAQDANGKTEPVIHLVATKDWKQMATIPLGTMHIPALGMVRFMPDGKGAVFQAFVDGKLNLWVKPFDGGVARQLTHFDSNDRIEDFHWSPDGKKLGILRQKQFADAVLFRDVEK